jgi:hypothetical protein
MTILSVTPNTNDDLTDFTHTLNELNAHTKADLEAPTHEPESNYISQGDIMLWLATKTNGMYGDLRQAMQMSEERSTLAKELKDLQTLLESDESNSEKLAAAQAVLEQVKGTPLEEEVTELVGPMVEILDGHPQNNPQQNAEWVSCNINGWAASLESYVSDLDHQDKLALITIQQTVGEIRDATQLASNLIASEQQASAAVIGNIRG